MAGFRNREAERRNRYMPSAGRAFILTDVGISCMDSVFWQFWC